MRTRQYEEDIRSRELYNALILQKNPLGVESVSRMPAYAPDVPQQLSFGKYLSMSDASKSLVGESKFIPLAQADGPLKPSDNLLAEPTQQDRKVALKLDYAFPAYPDDGPGTLSLGTLDPSVSVASSLGIENINRKNEERLRLLEKVEHGSTNELGKLDDLLFGYLNDKTRDQDYT